MNNKHSTLPRDFKVGSHVLSGQKYWLHNGLSDTRDLAFHHVTFSHHQHGEVGRLSWDQGVVKFTGNVDQSAEHFAATLQSHTTKYVQSVLGPYQNTVRLLAALVGILDSEQMQSEQAQRALDYLHDLEFFERRISGGL